jgi:SAM-dependent methyltransferase
MRELPFDRKNGVDTSGIISRQELSLSDPGGWGYMGTPAGEMRRAIRALPIDRGQYAFVDVGSGKGRGAFIASLYGFHSVVGIELSEELHGIATQNAAAWRERHPDATAIELVQGSALETALPDMPCVLYLNNPFMADTMRLFLTHVANERAGSPHPLLLVYRNPTCAEVFESDAHFQRGILPRLPKNMYCYDYVP